VLIYLELSERKKVRSQRALTEEGSSTTLHVMVDGTTVQFHKTAGSVEPCGFHPPTQTFILRRLIRVIGFTAKLKLSECLPTQDTLARNR
jgi:hypothetical protein